MTSEITTMPVIDVKPKPDGASGVTTEPRVEHGESMGSLRTRPTCLFQVISLYQVADVYRSCNLS